MGKSRFFGLRKFWKKLDVKKSLKKFNWKFLVLIFGVMLILIALLGYVARIFDFSFWIFGGHFGYILMSCSGFNLLLGFLFALLVIILLIVIFVLYKKKSR